MNIIIFFTVVLNQNPNTKHNKDRGEIRWDLTHARPERRVSERRGYSIMGGRIKKRLKDVWGIQKEKFQYTYWTEQLWWLWVRMGREGSRL